ncbi:MAG: TrkA C-terminal domain-containing protein [Planctomycetota bacterium]
MGPILALLAILAVSLWIVQAGSLALRMTGLDAGTSRFQAMSAFFGVGYTTSEAELVVSHPVRRRIVSHLIIAGNIGLTGALGTVVVTFVGSGDDGADHHPLAKVGFIAAVVLVVIVAARLTPRLHPIENLVKRAMARSGYVNPTDYELALRIHEGYGIGEVRVSEQHWLSGRSLAEVRTTRWHVLVVGITRADGAYVPSPTSETVVQSGDVLAVYGPGEMIAGLTSPEPPPLPPATERAQPGTSHT